MSFCFSPRRLCLICVRVCVCVCVHMWAECDVLQFGAGGCCEFACCGSSLRVLLCFGESLVVSAALCSRPASAPLFRVRCAAAAAALFLSLSAMQCLQTAVQRLQTAHFPPCAAC